MPPISCTSKWRWPQRPLGGLAHHREGLDQEVVQGLARASRCRNSSVLARSACRRGAASRRLERVDLVDRLAHGLDQSVVRRTEQPASKDAEHAWQILPGMAGGRDFRYCGQIGAGPGLSIRRAAAPGQPGLRSGGDVRPHPRWKVRGRRRRSHAVGHHVASAPDWPGRRTAWRDSFAASPMAAAFSHHQSELGIGQFRRLSHGGPSIAVRVAITWGAQDISTQLTPRRAACCCSATTPTGFLTAAPPSRHGIFPWLAHYMRFAVLHRNRRGAWAGASPEPGLLAAGRCYPPASGERLAPRSARPFRNSHARGRHPDRHGHHRRRPVWPVRRVRGRPARHEMPAGRQSRQDRRPMRRTLSRTSRSTTSRPCHAAPARSWSTA